MNGQSTLVDIRPVKYFSAIAVVLGLLFAFVSPDDDLAYSWASHFLLWQVQTLGPMLLVIFVQSRLAASGSINSLPYALQLVIAAAITSLIFCPVALLADIVIANEAVPNKLWAALGGELMAIAPPIMLFWFAVNYPLQFGWKVTKVDVSESPKESRPQPAFLKLLPNDLHGDLIYLKSELHYVLVVTTQGRGLILYSLRQATQELKGFDGLQTHRSYWVNKDYIVDMKKRGREGELTMTTGDIVPISRSKMADFI